MENYFGDDFDGSNDGSHPNDLGMYRIAEFMTKQISKLLELR